MFSKMCLTNLYHQFFSAWAVEKENKRLVGPKQFFSQITSWKRNNDKYSLKELIDSEFEIGETIWWICYRLEVELTNSPNADRNSQKLTLGIVALMMFTCCIYGFFYQSRSLFV